jgi:ATP-binding cassette subfamily F protein 3
MYSCRLRLEQADGPAPTSTSTPASTSASTPASTSAGRSETREAEKARKRREAEERQKRTRALGPLQGRVADLEARIGELEGAQKERGQLLADPAVYADAARRNTLLREYQAAQGKLDELTVRWEAAAEELSKAERELGD